MTSTGSVPLRLAGLLGVAVAAHSAPAAAGDERAACADSAEAGQTKRDEGDFLAARSLFVTCARATCPASVRSSCTTWLEQLEPRIPSVVVAVADARGRDVLGGKLLVDGREVGRVDGTAVAMNPGEHAIEVVVPSGERVSEHILARETDKARRVALVLAARAEEPARPRETPAAPSPPPVAGAAVPWWPAVAFAGVSVAGFVGFAVYDGKARDEYRELDATCAPSCRDDQLSSVRSKVTLSDVGLGVGIAGAALAVGWTVFHLATRPGAPPPVTAWSRGPILRF